MNRQKFLSEVINYKKIILENLDYTYLWVKISIDSILKIPGTGISYQVPSSNKEEKVRTIKSPKKGTIIFRITNRDIYYSAYVTLISLVEDFFNKIMKLLLKYDNKRIKCRIADVNLFSQISIVDFIDNDRDQLIDTIIDENINKLFYAGPERQFEYLDKALSIKLKGNLRDIWIEYKARRDVIVHNNGIINSIYISKTKGNNADLNNEVMFTDKNFTQIILNLKKIIEEIVININNEY